MLKKCYCYVIKKSYTFVTKFFFNYSIGAEVGTVITTITANDVDTNPALIYSFSEGGNPNNLFSIDRFSGRITLAQPLDHEKRSQYLIQIYASDSAHLAETSLTVHVTDINDNPPVFSQQPYQVRKRYYSIFLHYKSKFLFWLFYVCVRSCA